MESLWLAQRGAINSRNKIKIGETQLLIKCNTQVALDVLFVIVEDKVKV